MEWVNETGLAAGILRTELREDVMVNAVIVRIRHGLTDDGELVPPPQEQALADIRRDQIDLGDYGKLQPDMVFPRSGVDLIVLGDAIAPGGESTQASVGVACGPYDIQLDVWGDRVWEEDAETEVLKPSQPESFERMPITWGRAFGGAATGEYGDVPNGDNPWGRGFYLSAEEAVGKPLPNVELPSARVGKWDDHPEPGGFGPYPMQWGLRLMRLFPVGEDQQSLEVHPERGMFDQAALPLSGEQLDSQFVRITGMTKSGEVSVPIPPPPVFVQVELGKKTVDLDMSVEEVLVDLRHSLVDITYRKDFQYAFTPNETRRTTLKHAPATEGPAA
jgi:hypothetical protein